MKAIVAADKNWGIGYKGKLLVHIPDDMKFFKKTTLDKVVVMGRTTLESLPGGKPLKNRVNVVLSRNNVYKNEGIVLCRSKKEAIEFLGAYESDDVFVIGGESIYREFLPYCDEVYVTKIDKEYRSDRFFPNLDIDKNWKIARSSKTYFYNDIEYRFFLYKYMNGRNV